MLLLGCNPQKALNRKYKRLEKYAQEHGLTITDTITIQDTVIIESHSYDTLATFIHHDSVTVINNEKVRLKYFYDTLTREIFHEVTCKGDTLIREIVVPVDKIKIIEKENYFIWVLVGIIIIFLAYSLKRFL